MGRAQAAVHAEHALRNGHAAGCNEMCALLGLQLNKTFNAQYIFDDRFPESPTRTHGVQPNCNRCTGGYFQDYFSDNKTWVRSGSGGGGSRAWAWACHHQQPCVAVAVAAQRPWPRRATQHPCMGSCAACMSSEGLAVALRHWPVPMCPCCLQTPQFDSHFDAMNTLRFIGYAMYQSAGYTCKGLWDPAEPNVWEYGFYQDKLCQPLPDGVYDGTNYWG